MVVPKGPRINPLASDVLPLLFSREVEDRRVEKVVVVMSEMGFEEFKPWVSVILPLLYLCCFFSI